MDSAIERRFVTAKLNVEPWERVIIIRPGLYVRVPAQIHEICAYASVLALDAELN